MHQWASRDLDNLLDHLYRVFLIRNWLKSKGKRDIDLDLDMIDRKWYSGTLNIQNWQFRDLSSDFNSDKIYEPKDPRFESDKKQTFFNRNVNFLSGPSHITPPK